MRCPHCGFHHLDYQSRCVKCRKLMPEKEAWPEPTEDSISEITLDGEEKAPEAATSDDTGDEVSDITVVVSEEESGSVSMAREVSLEDSGSIEKDEIDADATDAIEIHEEQTTGGATDMILAAMASTDEIDLSPDPDYADESMTERETVPHGERSEGTASLMADLDGLIGEETGSGQSTSELVGPELFHKTSPPEEEQSSDDTVPDDEASLEADAEPVESGPDGEEAIPVEAAAPLEFESTEPEEKAEQGQEESAASPDTDDSENAISEAPEEDTSHGEWESSIASPGNTDHLPEEADGPGAVSYGDDTEEGLSVPTAPLSDSSHSSADMPLADGSDSISMSESDRPSGDMEDRLEYFFNFGKKEEKVTGYPTPEPEPDEDESQIRIRPASEDAEPEHMRLPFDDSTGSGSFGSRGVRPVRQEADERPSLPLGMLLRRTGAGLFDLVIWIVMGLVLYKAAGLLAGAPSLHGSLAEWVLMVVLPITIMTGVLALLYGGLFASIVGGTPGMLITGLRYSDGNGGRPSLAKSFINAAIYVATLAPFGLVLIMGMGSSPEEGLHGRFSGLKVVKA